jgi:hypothetical protein
MNIRPLGIATVGAGIAFGGGALLGGAAELMEPRHDTTLTTARAMAGGGGGAVLGITGAALMGEAARVAAFGSELHIVGGALGVAIAYVGYDLARAHLDA